MDQSRSDRWPIEQTFEIPTRNPSVSPVRELVAILVELAPGDSAYLSLMPEYYDLTTITRYPLDSRWQT